MLKRKLLLVLLLNRSWIDEKNSLLNNSLFDETNSLPKRKLDLMKGILCWNRSWID